MFFNNALVYRAAYVWVDGILLPLPHYQKDGTLAVTKRACKLMEVIARMGKSPRPEFNPYESDVARAGFAVIDEQWPQFPRKPSVYEKRGVQSL